GKRRTRNCRHQCSDREKSHAPTNLIRLARSPESQEDAGTACVPGWSRGSQSTFRGFKEGNRVLCRGAQSLVGADSGKNETATGSHDQHVAMPRRKRISSAGEAAQIASVGRQKSS